MSKLPEAKVKAREPIAIHRTDKQLGFAADPSHHWFGWIFYKHPDGQWVSWQNLNLKEPYDNLERKAQKLVEAAHDVFGMAEKIYGPDWRGMSDALTGALVSLERQLAEYKSEG